MDTPARKRIGDILIERGKLDAATLERALRLQQESGERLGALLVTLGVVAQRDVAEALAAQLDLPLVDAGSYPEFPILEETVSTRFLRETRALPLPEDDAEVALAMADPTDDYTIGAFQMVTGRTVRPMVAIPTELEAALERLYGTRQVGAEPGDRRRRDARGRTRVRRRRAAAEGPGVRGAGHPPGQPASSPTRSTCAPPTSTSSRSRTASPSATASTACCTTSSRRRSASPPR